MKLTAIKKENLELHITSSAVLLKRLSIDGVEVTIYQEDENSIVVIDGCGSDLILAM